MKTIEYNFVTQECKCQRSQICVADKFGEDCNAYDKADELKGTCPECNTKYSVTVVTNRPELSSDDIDQLTEDKRREEAEWCRLDDNAKALEIYNQE